MKLTEYAAHIGQFARYPEIHSARYCRLGLFGEVGELANKVKKILRDAGGVMSEDVRAQLIDELGDVLWYAVRLAHHRNFDLAGWKVWSNGPIDLFDAVDELCTRAGGVEYTCDVGAVIDAIYDVALQLDTTLHEVARINVAKLTGRAERGTLQGSGDVR